MENLLREKNIISTLEDRIITSLRESISVNSEWVSPLLQAIGDWTIPAENVFGNQYQYLILGEALDWLALADRLCSEIADMIPSDELESLLISGRLPNRFYSRDFKSFIGPVKYGLYLNYWYGIIVEEAIQNAIEKDIRKRHLALCYQDSEDLFESVFDRLYGESREVLMTKFWIDIGIVPEIDMTSTRMKEFTYWLHKIRVNKWDPARVASDTKRGILELEYYGISSF